MISRDAVQEDPFEGLEAWYFARVVSLDRPIYLAKYKGPVTWLRFSVEHLVLTDVARVMLRNQAVVCFKCSSLLTSTRSCGCSDARHGFVDPARGTFVPHAAAASRSKGRTSAHPKRPSSPGNHGRAPEGKRSRKEGCRSAKPTSQPCSEAATAAK